MTMNAVLKNGILMFGKNEFGKILNTHVSHLVILVVADLKIGTVILPRSETPNLISRLTEFEWFHKIDSTSETVTPEVDDILLKAQQTFQDIDEVIKGLEIPREVGMLEILFKGTVFKKQNHELDELERDG